MDSKTASVKKMMTMIKREELAMGLILPIIQKIKIYIKCLLVLMK